MAHVTVVQVHDPTRPTLVNPDAKHYIHSLAISTIPRIVSVSPKVHPSKNTGNRILHKLSSTSKSAQTSHLTTSIELNRGKSLDNVNDEHLETYFKSNGFFVENTERVYENLKDMSEKMLAGVNNKVVLNNHGNIRPQRKRSSAMRRPSIIDQNVGVTGTVYMVSDPAITSGLSSGDESDGSITSSRDSGSDSGISSTVERVNYSNEVNSTIIAIDTGTNNMLRGNGIRPQNTKVTHLNKNFSTQIIEPNYLSETILTEHNSKSESCNEPKTDSSSEDGEDAAEAEVTLEWRVIPPSRARLHQELQQQQEGDRMSTPTSFSSAYTVTEGADTESNSEESSVLSRRRWSSCPESDEESHSSGVNVNEQTIEPDSSDEINISEFYSIRELLSPSAGLLRLPEVSSSSLCRQRYPSSSSSQDDSIIYSYIPCKDQREKEDEELWVANEAADPRAYNDSPLQDNVTPSLIPPPWGWDNNNNITNDDSNSTQVRGRSPRHHPKCEPVLSERSRSADDALSSPTLPLNRQRRATLGPTSVNTLAMCTLAPTPTPHTPPQGPRGSVSLPRRHFSTRQRNVDTHKMQVEVVDHDEPKYKHNWTKLVDAGKLIDSKGPKSETPKKYSCLVRSKSAINTADSEMIARMNQANLVKAQVKVSASDQAILDKLKELNIDSSKTGISIKPRRSSSAEPPCCRCREPVYLNERTEPTLGLIYHTQCFKCHHCKCQLSLKTFYRNPKDLSKDLRVWCKSHVPSLDPPGKLEATTTTTTTTMPSSGQSSPDSAMKDSTSSNDGRDSRCSSSPLPPLVREVDIVKCDTIGLRYF